MTCMRFGILLFLTDRRKGSTATVAGSLSGAVAKGGELELGLAAIGV